MCMLYLIKQCNETLFMYKRAVNIFLPCETAWTTVPKDAGWLASCVSGEAQLIAVIWLASWWVEIGRWIN